MSHLFARFSGLLSKKCADDVAPAAPTAFSPPRKSKVQLLFTCPGQLFKLRKDIYTPVSDPGSSLCALRHVDASKEDEDDEHDEDAFMFQLCISENTGGTLDDEMEDGIVQDLRDGFTLNHHEGTGSIMWASIDEESGKLHRLAFKFQPPQSAPEAVVRQFIEIYDQCVYCCLTQGQLPLSAIGKRQDAEMQQEIDYVCGPTHWNVDVQQQSSQPQEISPPKVCRGGTLPEDTGATFDFVIDDEDHQTRNSTVLGTGGGGENRCFADSVIFNRLIVLKEQEKGKGTAVQAHRYTNTGLVSNEAPAEFSLKNVFKAKDAFLTNNDAMMMVVEEDAPAEESGVLAVDLERGEVVEKYQPGLDYAVKSVSAQQKDDPRLITCLNRTAAFSIDTRLDPKKCAVVESGKTLVDYTHKLRESQSFTCHATSAAGHLAIGDLLGQIRLFSGPPGSRKSTGKGYFPKTSKTLLNASPSNPILFLDITPDGQYILATCKEFLLVLATKYIDDAQKVQNGFESRMGANKPTPLRLMLSPEQMFAVQQAYVPHGSGKSKKALPTQPLGFGKATFGPSVITAPYGPLLVTWSMASVVKAIETRQPVFSLAKDEKTALRGVAPTGTDNTVKFITKDEVVCEHLSPERRAPKGGKVCFSF